jgi:methylmalonyl-CoA/ethylmalonyl-CoA epimerase
VPDQKVNVLVTYAGSQRIELVEPAAPDSPVSRFLAQRGGGLHHIAYEVDDLEAALARLKQSGVRLIDEHPRPGAHGTRIAFVYPQGMAGVLTELVELPKRR